MKISKDLTEFIEHNIKLLEDKTQHRELFYELLFGDYRTEQEVRDFFKLIEELNDIDLNESVKKHILDIIIEEIDERREYTTSQYFEQENTYYYSPYVSKDQLVKWIAICGVDSIIDFIAEMGDDMAPYMKLVIYDRGEANEENWVVYPDITLLYDYDPVQGQDYVQLFNTREDAMKRAELLSEHPQQLFEDILNKEYAREHNTLPDVDRFI